MINFENIGNSTFTTFTVKAPPGLGQPLFLLLTPIGARVEEEGAGTLLVEVKPRYQRKMENFLKALEELLVK